MIYRVEELNIGHLLYVLPNLAKDEKRQAELFGFDTRLDQMVVNCFAQPGPRWAFTDAEEKPFIVGGFIPLHPGVFRSWFLATRAAWHDYAPELTQIAVDYKELMFQNGAHRIETVCLATRKLAHRWYTTIGSSFESTLKQYCIDGSDATMFVETRRTH